MMDYSKSDKALGPRQRNFLGILSFLFVVSVFFFRTLFKAKEMLVTAFISEALDEIEDEGIKSALSHYIDNWTSSFFHE